MESFVVVMRDRLIQSSPKKGVVIDFLRIEILFFNGSVDSFSIGILLRRTSHTKLYTSFLKDVSVGVGGILYSSVTMMDLGRRMLSKSHA